MRPDAGPGNATSLGEKPRAVMLSVFAHPATTSTRGLAASGVATIATPTTASASNNRAFTTYLLISRRSSLGE